MTKFLTGKIAAMVAMLAGSMVITGCETTAGKPEICRTKGSSANQRCAKVNTPKARPKAKANFKAKKKSAPTVSLTNRNRSNY